MTQIHFEIRDPFGSVRQLSFDNPSLLWIGREAGCQIVIVAPNISRWHASIEDCAEGLKITDASLNGTSINDVRLHRSSTVVSDGACLLVVGSHLITVRRGEEGGQRPTAPPPGLRALPGGASARKPLTPIPFNSAVDTDPSIPENKPDSQLLASGVEHALPRLGPLERLLTDPDVSEIMVLNARTIFAESCGRLELTSFGFTDDHSVRAAVEHIVTPHGVRFDESCTLLDARLPDGSRLNAIFPPLALKGPSVTIRKHHKPPLTLADLTRCGAMTTHMATFLEAVVKCRKNVAISGGAASGKTTLLNALSALLPAHERIVTVENAAELDLSQPHVVSLAAHPPIFEGKGEYSVRDLVQHALRMRPDRIVVGECRGGEAVELVQAVNTGHEGIMTTIHADSPLGAVARIERLCHLAALNLPARVVRQQLVSSAQIMVHQCRFSDGQRRITSIAEVVGIDDGGDLELREIFGFKVARIGPSGEVEGEFYATGYRPSFVEQFGVRGLETDGARG